MPRKSNSELDTFIGARLRMRRLMLGMSQEALGEKLSLTFQQIQKYEKGTNRVSASRLYELAQALDVPVQYFFDGVSAEDEAVLHEAIAEDAHLSLFLDFVSSGQGIQLNSAFLQIGDRKISRDVLAMIEGISRVSAD
jgi:transcriptional regulator with XRE-family HTH domain